MIRAHWDRRSGYVAGGNFTGSVGPKKRPQRGAECAEAVGNVFSCPTYNPITLGAVSCSRYWWEPACANGCWNAAARCPKCGAAWEGPRLHPKINARAENFSFQGTISNRASLEVCLANFSRRSRTKKGGQPSIAFLAPPLLPIGAKDGLFPYPALIGRAAGILRRDRCSSLISPPGQKTGTENESRRTCAFECSDGPSAGH